MSKRVSGPPRRPRNPVAKSVRTPQYRMRVVQDKRGRWDQDMQKELEKEVEEERGEQNTKGKKSPDS